MTKDKRGGKRPGSGPKPQYSEPTKSVSFKVPISKVDFIKKTVMKILGKYKIKKDSDE
jgi:hypothetical protein